MIVLINMKLIIKEKKELNKLIPIAPESSVI